MSLTPGPLAHEDPLGPRRRLLEQVGMYQTIVYHDFGHAQPFQAAPRDQSGIPRTRTDDVDDPRARSRVCGPPVAAPHGGLHQHFDAAAGAPPGAPPPPPQRPRNAPARPQPGAGARVRGPPPPPRPPPPPPAPQPTP